MNVEYKLQQPQLLCLNDVIDTVGMRLTVFFCAFKVEKVLNLHELSSSTVHHTQGCSALDGQGLQAGLEKLYEMILKRKKMLRHSRKKR